jgi:hypothetical protein
MLLGSSTDVVNYYPTILTADAHPRSGNAHSKRKKELTMEKKNAETKHHQRGNYHIRH